MTPNLTVALVQKEDANCQKRGSQLYRVCSPEQKCHTGWIDWLTDWMPKPTRGHTGNYLPQCSSGRKPGGTDCETSISKEAVTPPAWVRTWGKPEAVGLEQNECNWSHLGRKNYFCWHVSSSTWRRLVCYGKTLKTIDCLWAVAHLSYDPSSMPQQFSWQDSSVAKRIFFFRH